MSDTAAANPEASAPEPAPDTGAAPEAPATPDAEAPAPAPDAPELHGDLHEGQTDGQPEIPEPAAPETVEVEINGLKYQVHPSLKDGYLMHADYSQKTMELAGKAKDLEGEREAFNQVAQSHRANIGDYGELAFTEQTLQGFRAMTTEQWEAMRQKDQDEGTDEYHRYRLQFDVLRDKHTELTNRISKREYDTRASAERDRATRRGQLTATLAREIPNYSPDLQGKMDETATRHGYTKAEVDSIVDPRMGQMLYLAHLGEQVLQQRRAATARPAPAPVKPVPKAGGGPTPTTGPNPKQGIDAWMRARNQQLKRGTG